MRSFNPEPPPGLRQTHFHQVGPNGLGDGHNAYAYSSVWYKDHLYVGTGRANLCLLKFAMPFVKIDTWPVECLHQNYTPEFELTCARGEIWRYSPQLNQWDRLYQAPLVEEEIIFSRHLGYRAMAVFQGESDSEPAIYAASWSRSRSSGPDILRCIDGKHFEITPKPRFQSQDEEIPITAIRVLVPFKGRLYTAPTGSAKGNVNISWTSLIYESRDPASGEWYSVNDPGFESPPEVATVYDMAAFGDYLYVGTGGMNGFQVWRTKAEGDPPYTWEKVLSHGAGRGALNQGTVSMMAFKDALYIGTGIQNGGYDHRFNVGPAAAEVIRLRHDGTWDIVVGNARDGKEPISGLSAGFNNYFCGYIWRMGIHQDWLYVGTMDWSVILRYTNLEKKPLKISQLLAKTGVEAFLECYGGCELWRTYDGENWLPVTKTGFDNPYNYGIRNIISSPYGLFVETANPFGPKVAVRTGKDWDWTYQDNPRGGLEVWQGHQDFTAIG
ncbi:MAG TPA: hypothetical protein V6D29_07750 [Leptolyngbyaceae cyanobacterium]